MIETQFISTLKCKELAGINGNTDDFLVTPIIREAQLQYIEPVIGTGIYNEIVSQIETDSVTVLNATLLDKYIIPCLVSYVKMEACIYLNYKFTNKNISTKSSDNSEPVGKDEAVFLMNDLRNKAEFKAERITKYLLANQTSYPLYTNPGTSIDTVRPSISNYTCGLVLDTCSMCGKEACKCWIFK